MKKLQLSDKWLTSPKTKTVWIIFVISILVATLGYIAVTISFLQTNSPVQLIPFQLTFDANTVESYYEGFIHQNTFSQYITTQFIDFIWIFGLLATLFFAHVLIARAQQYSIKWRRIALLMAIIAPLVASSDIFENIVSFIMLANPTDISPFLAILHASFASIKWLWAVLGTSFLLTQVIILVIYKIKFNK